MSSKEEQNISQHLNALKTISEQYSQIIQTFNTRLCSLEDSVKNFEFLLNEQQTIHSQLIKRVESVENDLSKQFISNDNDESSNPLNINENEPQQPQSPLITTIEETQYENNHNDNNNNNNNNNRNEYELEEIDLETEEDDDLLNVGLQSSVSSSLHSTNSSSRPLPLQQRYRTLSNRFPSPSPQALQASNRNNNNISGSSLSVSPNLSTSPLLYNHDINNNDNNDNNRIMPILEPGTEIEEIGSIQKENIPPTFADDDIDKNEQQTALQLFGLETLDNSNDNNDNDKDKDKRNNNNIDLEVLFSSFESMISLANQCMNDNDIETALEHLKDGLDELYKYINIKDIPSDKIATVSVAYCNRAICYGKLKKYNDGLIAINKCISIRPKWSKSYSTKATLYALQKKNNDAIKSYKEALKLCDNDDIETKHKIQKRIQMIIDREHKNKNNTNNNNKKRRNDYDLLDESPAKRVKYNNDNKREKELKERLNMKTVSELQIYLEINKQKKTGKKDEIIERVSDGILNGAIPKCPKCIIEGRGNKSFLKYNKNNGYYQCHGVYDKISKRRIQCQFYSNNVQRKPWIINKNNNKKTY